MKRRTTWWGWIYLSWFYTVLALTLIVLYPFLIYGLRDPSRHHWVHRLRSRACRFVLFITGVRTRFPNKPDWPNRPVIFLANHTSILDILVGLAIIPQPVVYVGKAELRNIPLFGRFFKYLDIPVERGNSEKGAWVMEQAIAKLREGWSVVWFPEGTTSLIAPDLLKFKNGAFRLAVRAHIPVVPVTFVDHWHLQHYDRPGDNRPGKNRVDVGSLITPGTGEGAMLALKRSVRSGMMQILMQYWPEQIDPKKFK